jgi:hypothetical protein
MADTNSSFRCYYEDGSITTADFCPNVNDNGSPLLSSEFQIIEQVNSTPPFPWLLVILAMVALVSKNKKG